MTLWNTNGLFAFVLVVNTNVHSNRQIEFLLTLLLSCTFLRNFGQRLVISFCELICHFTNGLINILFSINFRKFGTSKRLSEVDKKEIAGTIAIKIQMSKEEWKLELNRLQFELRETMTECKVKENQILEMDKQLAEFIRQNRTALVSQAHDLTSTTDLLRTSIADNDVIARMEERLQYVLQRMRRVIEERDLMQNDRDQCFKTLGISDDTQSLLLHQVVSLKLVDMPKNVGNYREELAKKDQIIKRVRRLLQDYEIELENKDQKIVRLKSDLVAKDTQMASLEERIGQLEREKLNREMVVRAQTAYNNRAKSTFVTRSAKPGKRRGSLSAIPAK